MVRGKINKYLNLIVSAEEKYFDKLKQDKK